ncbi:unnamed protein product [Cunninghamella echinulata]
MEDTVIQLPHNNLCLELRKDPIKGRGVFSTKLIPNHTLIDISPILLFNCKEYADHGKYTVLDHYTYVWENGNFALALGLGSMFNHDKNPNVGFIRNFKNNVIKYITLRDIQPNEELNISYGSNLWFDDANNEKNDQQIAASDDDDDTWLQTMMID